MFINGFGFNSYKSFGEEIQHIGPFSKINLFIGQNNSGKSNILSFISKHYKNHINGLNTSSFDQKAMMFNSLEIPRSGSNANRLFSVHIPKDDAKYNDFLNKDSEITNTLKQIFKSKHFTKKDGNIWLTLYVKDDSMFFHPSIFSELADGNSVDYYEWLRAWTSLTNQSGGDIRRHWVPEIINTFRNLVQSPPEISLIPAIRKIGDQNSNPTDFSGIGIINRLAVLQNPSHDKQELKKDFREINSFLKSVTGNNTAELEIPNDRSMIIVHMDGRTLPLESLGTGIHEVIILAAAATILQNQVLCIEELELHLHPILQRKLIRYLRDKTTNQYFITTHSAHLLDTVGAAVFHVRHQDGVSKVDAVHSAADKAEICFDLGYRASDLLQANCVIWVEGPSDRIYLNHWIKSVDNELIEGIHYSIMFYGGRLLSHLSARDPEVTEFISLRRLNRNISIVIDSDKDKLHGRINATKKRVADEFNEGPGFAWITKGREIENYISPDKLEIAVKEVHPSAVKLYKAGQFDNSLYFKNNKNKLVKDVDKVKVAHRLSEEEVDLTVLDLKQQVEKLVKFIRNSNDTDDFINA
jgi:AAA15 family ATPase/GTPase